MTALEDRLRAILRADPVMATALTAARAMDLPDWWIVSGAVYNTAWNHLTGKPPGHGIKDIDLFYFDPDTSWEAEDRVIRRGARHFPPTPPVEIRNQARVHLWYRDHFGHPMRAYRDCADSIANFAAQTHAVGVRLCPDESLEICSPYGLEAIFQRRLVPNTRHMNRRTHETKAARLTALWDDLTVEPWPAVTIIPAEPWHDWEAIRALIARAFDFMDGRIDPPSSLHRMTAADFAAEAAAHPAFLAHDGYAITGCVFTKPVAGALDFHKLAVDPDKQRMGIGRALMQAVEAEARARALPALGLQTRIELTANHATFAAMGFIKAGETAHPGFDRPTSITMRKPL